MAGVTGKMKAARGATSRAWRGSPTRGWRRISMPCMASPMPRRDLGDDLGVVEVRRGLDDGLRHCSGSSDLKMPEPTKTPSAPSCIISAASAGVAMPPAAKLHDGQLAGSATSLHQLVRAPGAPSPRRTARRRACRWRRRMSSQICAHVADGLDDVAGAGLALGADHGGALGDAAQRLAEVRGSRRRTAP